MGGVGSGGGLRIILWALKGHELKKGRAHIGDKVFLWGEFEREVLSGGGLEVRKGGVTAGFLVILGVGGIVKEKSRSSAIIFPNFDKKLFQMG